MLDYPTERYIKISCRKGHAFTIQVRKLIYDYHWCPYCNEYFCEILLRFYLEQLFKKNFEIQVSLNKACGIERDKVTVKTIEIEDNKYIIRVFAGQLRYDHFCANIYLTGNNGVTYTFVVAGEYDGIYHDEEDISQNPFCDDMGEFASIKARDSVKNDISYRKKVILIRLKEKDGFNQKKLLHNQKEVFKEIAKQFNKQVKDLFGFNDVRIKYDPYLRFDPFGEKKSY